MQKKLIARALFCVVVVSFAATETWPGPPNLKDDDRQANQLAEMGDEALKREYEREHVFSDGHPLVRQR